MKRFLSWPVRAHLMLLVFAAIIPALAIIFFSGFEREQVALQSLRENATRRVRDLSTLYSITVVDTRRLLTTLAEMPEVRAGDKETCRELFVRLLQKNPQFNTIQMSRNGVIVASSNPLPEKVSILDRKYYQEAVLNHSFAVGEYIIGRTTHKPMINFACPVLETNGEVLAVVQAGISLEHFSVLFKNIELPPGALALVTDHRGTILDVFPRDPTRVGGRDDPSLFARMTNASGAFVYTGPQGDSQFAVYEQLRQKAYSSPYLCIRLSLPEAPMVAEGRRVLWRNVGLLILAGLLAGGAAWYLGNVTIVHPVQVLTSATRRLGAGNLDVRVETSVVSGEIGRLASVFDEMALTLRTREQERNVAELALRQSEQRFRVLMEKSVIGFGILHGTQIVYVNAAGVRMLGCSEAAKMIGQSLLDFVAPDSVEGMRQRIEQRLDGDNAEHSYESNFRRLDGTIFPVWVQSNLIALPDGLATVIALHDMTERRLAEQRLQQLEAELRQAHKMEAIGRLAGGVAHDFNNILTAILGNTELMLEDPAIEPVRAELEEVKHAALRASDLIRQLLAFSRKQIIAPVILDLNTVIRESQKMLERLIGEDIKLIFDPAPDLWHVRADSSQVAQILINLAVNARDAMEHGGRMVIESRNIMVEGEETGAFPGFSGGPCARLKVTDTGTGMDQETLRRVFEPFFTTKGQGKGTGLGLATVYGIVNQNKGSIVVQSEVGQGTTFTILFPAAGEGVPSRLQKL